MPTNKLWIEHTERAAWQSVQALREKLAEAEQRVERMAPPAEGWRELFDALDAARESHTLAGKSYAELLRSALERLARADADRRSLEAASARGSAPLAPLEARPVRASRSSRDSGWDEDEGPRPERATRAERRLFREIRLRARELSSDSPRPDLDAELAEIEARLAELPELDPGEIREAAADLAALALCLGPGSAPDDDD